MEMEAFLHRSGMLWKGFDDDDSESDDEDEDERGFGIGDFSDVDERDRLVNGVFKQCNVC